MTDIKPEISVWLAHTDLGSQEGSTQSITLLSEAEREKYHQITRPSRQQQYLAGRVLAHKALNLSFGDNTEQLKLAANGRPDILNPQTKTNISISHHKGCASCALANSPLIGIDIEPLAQCRDWEKLAKNSFSSTEWIELLDSNWPTNRHFLALWTLKEAFCKATNTPLHTVLEKLKITQITTIQPDITYPQPIRHLQFGLYQFDDQLIALCWSSKQPCNLTFYRLNNLTEEPENIYPKCLLLTSGR